LFGQVSHSYDARGVETDFTYDDLNRISQIDYSDATPDAHYYYDSQVGFLSLNQPLQSDEVLGVAFRYTFNGKIYQVGEFSQDVPPDGTTGNQNVLFLKLLKATSQRPGTPMWDLMLKNVYSVGYGTLTPTDFKLDVLYQEPGLGWKRYVPFGNQNAGTPIISLLNLDRLNNQLDPQPDGVFDYVEGYTVFSQFSRVMFPVLEPFGRDLDTIAFAGQPQSLKNKYVFYQLYDTIKAVAQTYAKLFFEHACARFRIHRMHFERRHPDEKSRSSKMLHVLVLAENVANILA